MKITFDKYAYNPIYWHIKKYLKDPKIRYIYIPGGSSGGKTHAVTQLLTENTLEERVNSIVFRKESSTLWKSVYNDFKGIATKINKDYKFFDIFAKSIRADGAVIEFSGMDDPEKVKGLASYKYPYLNELSKFEFGDWKELKRRMRGIFGQTALFDWNPISITHWIKTEVIDKDTWHHLPTFVEDCPGISQLDKHSSVMINEKGNSILITTTYRDNFWIVGHPIEGYGFKDQATLDEFEWSRIHTPYDYQVYGLGRWGQLKTGNEFYRNFNIDKHVKSIAFDPSKTIHVSVDANKLPYIAVTLWQIDVEGKKVKQIHEIPAKDPNNFAAGAGKLVVEYLLSIGYEDVVYLYGDATTRAGNAIDPDKKSFYDLFTEQIESRFQTLDLMRASNPRVAASGEFVNALYAGWHGWELQISDTCRTSISDYVETKMNKDGGLLKVMVKDKESGLSYEKNGHLSDTKRYFMVRALESLFIAYKNRYAPKHESYIESREEL